MNIALSIGNFDAVHLGHIAIVEAARKVAGEGLVVIWSFNPSPTAFLHPEMEVERLTEFPHRRALLLAAGADEVVELVPTAIDESNTGSFCFTFCKLPFTATCS